MIKKMYLLTFGILSKGKSYCISLDLLLIVSFLIYVFADFFSVNFHLLLIGSVGEKTASNPNI